MRSFSHRAVLVTLATVALSFAGCGDSSDSEGGTDAPTIDAPSTATDAPSGAIDAPASTIDGMTAPCTDPVFMTDDPNGGTSDGGYYIHNNMWNSDAGLGPETLYACSYHNWYVVSNQTNNAGAVKTYPNVHKDYEDVPISSFSSLTSRFAETSPHVGIYDVAFDIWLNGVATEGSTELMVWTDNYNQVPAGDQVATVTWDDRTYDVWRTSGGEYIAFVPAEPYTSGTFDILEMFDWTVDQGWLDADATVGQIGFGIEIVETGGGDATFYVTDFAITEN